MGLIMPFLLIKASISVSLALSTLSLFHLYIVLSFSLPHTDKALEPQRSSQKVASKNILCTIINVLNTNISVYNIHMLLWSVATNTL